MERRVPSTSKLLLLGVLLAVALVGVGVAPALEAGEEAPDFTLPRTLGENISLRQFRGKHPVLIEFFGGDFPV
jgi:hypothetical protein